VEMTPKRGWSWLAARPTGLAEEIASCLGVTLSETNIRRFADGEIHCRFDASMRGADMFIVQTHSGPVNDSIMEQLIMVDAAKRASAHRITAVCPYYGYSRQDRKATGREPITAKLVADLLSAAGVDRVVSVDLHSGQIQGFFDVPVTISPRPRCCWTTCASTGRRPRRHRSGRRPVKVAERYSQLLDTDLALVHKRHPRGTYNEVEAMTWSAW